MARGLALLALAVLLIGLFRRFRAKMSQGARRGGMSERGRPRADQMRDGEAIDLTRDEKTGKYSVKED